MVDYSKWDNLDDTDSDSSPSTSQRGPLRFTSLPGKGCSVTIGPKGVTFQPKTTDDRVEEIIEDSPSLLSSTPATPATPATSSSPSSSSSSSSTLPVPVSSPSSVSLSPSVLSTPIAQLNSSRLCTSSGFSSYYMLPYYFHQTASDVFLYFKLPYDMVYSKKNLHLRTKMINLVESGASSFSVPLTSSNIPLSCRLQLEFSETGKESVLRFSLPYPVHLEGDPTNEYDEPLDWEILTGPIEPEDSSSEAKQALETFLGDSSLLQPVQRLSIRLRKENPLPSSVFWWDRAVLEDSKILQREVSQRTREFQEVYSTAEETFFKKIQE